MLRPLGLFRGNSNVLHVHRGVARLFFYESFSLKFVIVLIKRGVTLSQLEVTLPNFHVNLHTVFD